MQNPAFWQFSVDQLYSELQSRREGLSSKEAENRLRTYGPNRLKPPQRGKGILLLFAQFKSPLILLLIGAALLSLFLRGYTDAVIILAIVVLSGLLGFFQEHGAIKSLEKLLKLVENKAAVLRDGKEVELPLIALVPGDIVILNAGDLVPADCLIIEANHFLVDEATLTGESLPVEKQPGLVEINAIISKRTNSVFFGTMVASGIARVIVVATGKNTEYGRLYEQVRKPPPETAFELGVRKFSNFLLIVTLLLVGSIFAINILLQKPFVDSLLFALAIAVGLTPQLLPAIISVNLSHGARRMAAKKVIVKRLAAIENFGQMNVLCVDKTGTLTIGKIQLEEAIDYQGKPHEKTALYGFLNAFFQKAYTNPLDEAIREKVQFATQEWKKVSEIPYDFVRKRLSILLEKDRKKILITKGAFPQVISLCDRLELPDGRVVPLPEQKSAIETYFEHQSAQGLRLLAVAYGDTQESDLIFLGFLKFSDPIKPDIAKTVADLRSKGIQLKILTGDYPAVALHVAETLGVSKTAYIAGSALHDLDEAALIKIVNEKDLFVQIEPKQKQQIVAALRKSGNIVGYMGDGVNDVSALHSADVGIAVDSGADAAKEAADFVLLEKDLSVLRSGIEEGRITFVNTLKYIYMATSANFGNMFSMAGLSLFLKFLPLLPKQVLLVNFLSDLPEMALATDRVDYEVVQRPVKWNLPMIRRFMLVFGLLSSLADYLTFFVLLFWFNLNQSQIRTGWFIESVVSAALVVFAIRTRRFMLRSKPGRLLTVSVLAIAIGVPFLPYTGIGKLFGFSPIPLAFYGIMLAIVAVYLTSVEIAKKFFFHRRSSKAS